MAMKIGILMDPISKIHVYKDTSFALLLALQARNYELHYMEAPDIFLQNRKVHAFIRRLQVKDNTSSWFELSAPYIQPLNGLDIFLMRKDPPFNMSYIYLTYFLELAEKEGLFVVNKPASLRDANEKLFASWFPQCTPKTLVTSRKELLQLFLQEQKEIIIKPLGAMAGKSIFRLTAQDPNVFVVIDTMTANGKRLVMAQQFIPAIKDGDKRIILINGEPIPYALARIPAKGDFRGNLAVGARGVGQELTDHDRWICQQVGPTLCQKGLWFVGLDVIGDYLTEINVTSPTGIRELETQFKINIADQFVDFLEKQFNHTRQTY
ncbi:glutathione synthase [Coxiella-like endosymbiont of Rhipicephalus sanguineus]|nr:glutathione synthase [Coxiella-like endosymbiont of Rhipicephalus sanguineus]MBT8506632.1 glutathione synthase [Coxiella-like endosymbiont of Rhipicephalus sanguineus]